MEKTDQIRQKLLNAYRVLLHTATLRKVELRYVFIGYSVEQDSFLVLVQQRDRHRGRPERLTHCIQNFVNLKCYFIIYHSGLVSRYQTHSLYIEGYDARGFTHVTLNLDKPAEIFHVDPKIYKYHPYSD
jgi:hypothetical protein